MEETNEALSRYDIDTLVALWKKSTTYTRGKKIRDLIESKIPDLARHYRIENVETFSELVWEYDWQIMEYLHKYDLEGLLEFISFAGKGTVRNFLEHFYGENRQSPFSIKDVGILAYKLTEKEEDETFLYDKLPLVLVGNYKYDKLAEGTEGEDIDEFVDLCFLNKDTRAFRIALIGSAAWLNFDYEGDEDLFILIETLLHHAFTKRYDGFFLETIVDLIPSSEGETKANLVWALDEVSVTEDNVPQFLKFAQLIDEKFSLEQKIYITSELQFFFKDLFVPNLSSLSEEMQYVLIKESFSFLLKGYEAPSKMVQKLREGNFVGYGMPFHEEIYKKYFGEDKMYKKLQEIKK